MFPNGTFQNSVSLLQAPFFVSLFLRLGRNVSMWAGICSYNIYKKSNQSFIGPWVSFFCWIVQQLCALNSKTQPRSFFRDVSVCHDIGRNHNTIVFFQFLIQIIPTVGNPACHPSTKVVLFLFFSQVNETLHATRHIPNLTSKHFYRSIFNYKYLYSVLKDNLQVGYLWPKIIIRNMFHK